MSVTLKKKSMRSKSQRKTKLMKRNLKLNKTRKMRGGSNAAMKAAMKKPKLGKRRFLGSRSSIASITHAPAQAPKRPAPFAEYMAAKNVLANSQSSSSIVSSSGSSPRSSPRSSPPSSPQNFSKIIQSTKIEPRFVTRVGPNGETFFVPRERVGAFQIGNEERLAAVAPVGKQEGIQEKQAIETLHNLHDILGGVTSNNNTKPRALTRLNIIQKRLQAFKNSKPIPIINSTSKSARQILEYPDLVSRFENSKPIPINSTLILEDPDLGSRFKHYGSS